MYSMQHDPPWVPNPARGSLAPSVSVYSDDDEYQVAARLISHPDMPEIQPLRLDNKPSYHPSYHAHPNQQVRDSGPQVRQSKMPIFKQVRGLLQRPPPRTPTKDVKYDEFSGDIGEFGKAPDVRPSSYTNPYAGAFEARKVSRGSRRHQVRPTSGRSLSPVSILNQQDVDHVMNSPDIDWDSEISPVEEEDEDTTRALESLQVSEPARAPPSRETASQSAIKAIRRKPAPSQLSVSPKVNQPDTVPNPLGIDHGGFSEHSEPLPASHFSWTTRATSIAPTLNTIDTGRPSSSRVDDLLDDNLPPSRFSWSTVNTHMTAHARPASPSYPLPPLDNMYQTPTVKDMSKAPPPIENMYKTPPVQSILSRHRPIQRIEKEEWIPPPRKTSLPDPETSTPTSARFIQVNASRPVSSHGSSKKLPLPPELLTPMSSMSHLETLLAEEQDRIRQRRNIEHAIADLSKVEKASPLEVSYAQVKDADRKLKELRTTLAEVQLEEREIGIAISRARRKEGEEEGLWVRRVTG